MPPCVSKRPALRLQGIFFARYDCVIHAAHLFGVATLNQIPHARNFGTSEIAVTASGALP